MSRAEPFYAQNALDALSRSSAIAEDTTLTVSLKEERKEGGKKEREKEIKMSSDQDDRALNYTRQMSIQDESSVEDDEVLSAIYSEDDLDDDNLLLEDDDSGEKEVRKMALKLSKDVWTWKFFVVLIILSTAGFLSAAAYYFITESETQDYEDSVSQFLAFFCCS